MRKGLFVVLEGIDGAGSTTQRDMLVQHILDLNKYNSVLATREPWNSEDIKEALEEDKDAYSNGALMASLFVDDRVRHTSHLMIPSLEQGTHVVSDRYSMSTCAYQMTQGVDLERLLELHRRPGIIMPDLTVFVDIDADTAFERVNMRKQKIEKYEKKDFQEKLIDNYQTLIRGHRDFFGPIILVEGTQPIESVHNEVVKGFNQLYEDWKQQNA